MALTICQNGDKKLLGYLQTYLQSVKIYLYVNNHTPTETDTVGSYTAASNMSYQTASWGSPFINGSGKAEIDLTSSILFTQSSATTQTVYGLFGVDPNDGSLVFAGLFASSINLVNSGDGVQITQFNITLADFC